LISLTNLCLLQNRVCNLLLSAVSGNLEDRRGDLSGCRERAVRVSRRRANIAEISCKTGDGKLIGDGRFFQRLRGLQLLCCGLEIFARCGGLGERCICINMLQRFVRRGVSESEVLVQGKANAACERELIFGKLVGGRD